MEAKKIEQAMKNLNIDMGVSFNECNSSLNKFKEKINELKMLERDPENYIYEYFSNLRNEIDIDRERFKALIDIHYLNLIDEVNNFEEECRKKNKDYKNEKIIEEIAYYEDGFKEFKKDLSVLFKNGVKKCDEVKAESEDKIIRLNQTLRVIQNTLLSNQLYLFESSETSREDNLKSEKIVVKQVNKLKINFSLNRYFKIFLNLRWQKVNILYLFCSITNPL